MLLWEFLQDALAAVGFGKDFIDYVLLAYSHTTPPTRQIYVNGFFGPSFPLGSGVAQGCPLSPLLFLIIAEPLTRLFNQNRNIYGIVFKAGKKTYRHKISQFADDSTLILRTADIAEALRTLQIWCDATSMKENETKREILLLGLLRRHTLNSSATASCPAHSTPPQSHATAPPSAHWASPSATTSTSKTGGSNDTAPSNRGQQHGTAWHD